MKNVIIVVLSILTIYQTRLVFCQQDAINKLDKALSYVVYRCTGMYIPTIEEHNDRV